MKFNVSSFKKKPKPRDADHCRMWRDLSLPEHSHGSTGKDFMWRKGVKTREVVKTGKNL